MTARIGLLVAAAMVTLVPTAVFAEDAVIASPDALKWAAAPPVLPKGAQIAVLFGDPGKPGPFVFRLMFPADYKVAAHMHPNDYNVTVLSGTFYLAIGDKFDPTHGQALKAGGYARVPKGMHHYEWTTEDTMLELSGIGPIGMTYLNPADDPRKSNRLRL